MANETEHCIKRDDCEVSDELRDFKLEIRGDLKAILESLNGNGKPGIKTRLALLEDTSKTMRGVAFVIVVAVIGLVVKAIWGLT